jgi:hypothetical protein
LDIHLAGLGSTRLLSNGFYVEVCVGGHVAIKTPSAIFDPVNKVFRIEGVWSIPGGREITPEHQIFTLGVAAATTSTVASPTTYPSKAMQASQEPIVPTTPSPTGP